MRFADEYWKISIMPVPEFVTPRNVLAKHNAYCVADYNRDSRDKSEYDKQRSTGSQVTAEE